MGVGSALTPFGVGCRVVLVVVFDRLDGGFFFAAGFFGFGVVHGLSPFRVRRSLLLAVPYLCNLVGHLLESAGCSWSFS